MRLDYSSVKTSNDNSIHFKYDRKSGCNSFPRIIRLEEEEYHYDCMIKDAKWDFIPTLLVTNVQYKNKNGRVLMLDL